MLTTTTLAPYVLSTHMALPPTQIAVTTVHQGPTRKDRPVEQMPSLVVNRILSYFRFKHIFPIFSVHRIFMNIFSCSVCPMGSFLDADNSGTCQVCPVNEYSTTTNSASCMNCPLGTNTQQQTGQVSVDACSK